MPDLDDSDILQNDLRELLDVLGMPSGAQPRSPHKVFQDALAEVKRLASQSNWVSTDDADWRTVLRVTRGCAMAWEPQVRLLGNVRAGDLARAIDEALRTSPHTPGLPAG